MATVRIMPRPDDLVPVGRTERPAPMPVRVRVMTAGDVDVVAAIEAQSFSDPWPRTAFAELLQVGHARMRVAMDAQGTPVGYCVMLVVLDEREVANICVDAAVRGAGVAGRLLDEALASADGEGATVVYLEVRESNTAAQRLYRARGFHLVGRRRGYYQHPTEDALVLRRERRGASSV